MFSTDHPLYLLLDVVPGVTLRIPHLLDKSLSGISHEGWRRTVETKAEKVTTATSYICSCGGKELQV